MALNIISVFENEPPELDFIWHGFLAGTVGALIAPGGTGKSFWALEAAMAVASGGVPGGDLLGIKPKYTGRVVYFAAEDPEVLLIHRVHALGQHIPPAARDAIAEKLVIEPIMGDGLDIMKEDHVKTILDYCRDTRLIIFDTLSRIHALEENSNGDMSKLVTTLESIAKKTEASVLYLHHTSKSAALNGDGDKQQAARGASALVDNARWVGYLTKMDEYEAEELSEHQISKTPILEDRRYFLKFGVSKQNYSEPLKEQWYRRVEGGVLQAVELCKAKKQKAEGGKGSGKKNNEVKDEEVW
jgi:RecA-family ATPase